MNILSDWLHQRKQQQRRRRRSRRNEYILYILNCVSCNFFQMPARTSIFITREFRWNCFPFAVSRFLRVSYSRFDLICDHFLIDRIASPIECENIATEKSKKSWLAGVGSVFEKVLFNPFHANFAKVFQKSMLNTMCVVIHQTTEFFFCVFCRAIVLDIVIVVLSRTCIELPKIY